MLGRTNYDAGPLVYTPKKGPNATKKNGEKKKRGLTLALDALVVLLVAGATFAMFKLTNVKPENTEKNNPTVVTAPVEEEDDEEETREITLQSVINSWFSSFSRETEKGIVIYDLENERVVGNLDENEQFDTASLYKLFVVYEGYQRVELGEWKETDESYGGMTVGDCLDKAIRESHSGCAENLLARIGEQKLDEIIRSQYGLENTSVERLVTTASDMAKFMTRVYKHKELSEASYAKLADSMLNQPKTESEDCEGGVCDWRMGVPAGFSETAKVYNKVGWGWNGIYWTPWNDVMIVEYPQYNRHFVIAFLSRKFPTVDRIREFGSLVDEALAAYLELE
ncbi:serine hydrolase [Candidatus Saccharibacteria bacterium]|nr:serine hydrolase [Candidatus Saccharibacteria bacterium]